MVYIYIYINHHNIPYTSIYYNVFHHRTTIFGPHLCQNGPGLFAGCHGGSEAGHGAQDPGDHGREAVGVTDGHWL